MKTFKRFTIPRSASAIDTFTTPTAPNGSTNIDEQISNQPPVSHVQHFRTHLHHSEQNLNHLPRTTSTDISTLIMHSTSNDLSVKKSKVIHRSIED